jgi:glycosyltransferase involved in cell wall biosynthesis
MEKNNSVVVSCGTKFHSDYMAGQLEKHGLLNRVITSHPSSRYLNRIKIPKSKTMFLPPFFALSHFLEKLKIRSNRLNRSLNYQLPLLYDMLAAKFINKSSISITWAWAGLATIKKIKAKGGIAIIEECGSCNLFQNRLLEEEYNALGLEFKNRTPEFIVTRELEEIRIADYVLCPSMHVAQSFNGLGIPFDKFKIIPYGANLSLFQPTNIPKSEFTILFVGTIGVRKGLIYLFRALEILQPKLQVKCILIGRLEDQFEEIFRKYADLFIHIPKVDHHKISQYYNQASVFVFPSLDEGMAYVQLEAMACGLPVICTFNSGGDSIIDDGKDGFIIPIRDAEAIANKIEYLHTNPLKMKEMAGKAAEKAKEFSWDRYGDKLAAFIKSL